MLPNCAYPNTSSIAPSAHADSDSGTAKLTSLGFLTPSVNPKLAKPAASKTKTGPKAITAHPDYARRTADTAEPNARSPRDRAPPTLNIGQNIFRTALTATNLGAKKTRQLPDYAEAAADTAEVNSRTRMEPLRPHNGALPTAKISQHLSDAVSTGAHPVQMVRLWPVW